MPLPTPARGRHVTELLASVGPPLLFLLVMLACYPAWDAFQFDADEGLNLIKARLLLRGYPLYTEIWSDQPPLLTYLLAGAMRLLGDHVVVGRLVVLVLSSALLGAVWNLLRRTAGWAAAALGVVALLAAPHYVALSLAVMVGLPAIALAMLALAALVRWHSGAPSRPRALGWLVASAVLLALAALTKLFVATLAPVCVLGLAAAGLAHRPRGWRALLASLGPATLWSAIFALATGGLLLWLVGWESLPMLLVSHLAGREIGELSALTLSAALAPARLLLYLALLGAALAIWRRRWLLLYPAGWALASYLALAGHAPVWYHQGLLVTVPAALLAGWALAEAARTLLAKATRRQERLIVALAVVLLATGLALGDPQAPRDWAAAVALPERPDVEDEAEDEAIVARVRAFAPQTHWFITDVPMLAFRAGLLVPPELAVISNKRLLTGGMNEYTVLREVNERHPELVLLTRFHWPMVDAALAGGYRGVMLASGDKLRVRADLLRLVPPSLFPRGLR